MLLFDKIRTDAKSPASGDQPPYQRRAESALGAGLFAFEGGIMTDKVFVDEDTVDAVWGCPECGERRVDWLIWLNDQTVQCQTCGSEYRPDDAKGDAS